VNTKLTPEILKTFGFVELERKDIVDRPIYSLVPQKTQDGSYAFHIEVVLNPEYPESNPNSGIVSVHMPPSEIHSVPEDLWDKDDWTEEDQKRADEHVIQDEGFTQPIAWHVTTFERLQSIVTALTTVELSVLKKLYSK
jgi:hypothetical protein